MAPAQGKAFPRQAIEGQPCRAGSSRIFGIQRNLRFAIMGWPKSKAVELLYAQKFSMSWRK